MDFDPERVARSPFTVGAIGAFIAAFKFLPGAGWKERTFNGVCGTAVAGFLTPVLIEWLRVASPVYAGGAAFVTGLLGMSLAAAAVDWVRSGKLGDVVSSWTTRR